MPELCGEIGQFATTSDLGFNRGFQDRVTLLRESCHTWETGHGPTERRHGGTGRSGGGSNHSRFTGFNRGYVVICEQVPQAYVQVLVYRYLHRNLSYRSLIVLSGGVMQHRFDVFIVQFVCFAELLCCLSAF